MSGGAADDREVDRTIASNLPRIPGITLHHEIARGGMGVVYSGRQDFLDRRVAVKFLSVDLGGAAFAQRFQREAKLLAGISHPNIVSCHMADTTPDGQSYLVMEFIDGPSLKAWVQENGPVAPIAALRLVRSVAQALAHAYLSDVIHRDVKPENILLETMTSTAIDVSFPFTPKLVDLGLARMTCEQVGAGLTSPGSVMGTPATMSPEQFDDPDSVDFRSDIYGLGCCLYEMLVGAPAFRGNKLTEIVARKRQAVGPNPCDERSGLPAAVGALCQRMLASDRSDRPASYRDLDDEIAELIRALEAAAARSDTVVQPGADQTLATVVGAPGPLPPRAPAKGEATEVAAGDRADETAPGMLNTGELDFLSQGGGGGSAAADGAATGFRETQGGAAPDATTAGGRPKALWIGVAAVLLAAISGGAYIGMQDGEPGAGGDAGRGAGASAPPVVFGIEGPALVDLDEVVEFEVIASDPDGDPLSYEWQFPYGCMAALSPTDEQRIRLRLDDGLPGVELVVTCVVRDLLDHSASASGRHVVTVGACPQTMPLFGWQAGGWTEAGGCFWSQPMAGDPEDLTLPHAAGRVRSGPGTLTTSLGADEYWEWSGLMMPTEMPGDDDTQLPGRGTVAVLFGDRGYRFECTREDAETSWSITIRERVPGTDEWRPLAEPRLKAWKQSPTSNNESRAWWSVRRERGRLVLQLGEFVQPVPRDAGAPLPDPVYDRGEPFVVELDADDAAALAAGRLELGVQQARCQFRASRR